MSWLSFEAGSRPEGLRVWRFLKFETERRVRQLPDGLRIYAIGDVHGRADLLSELFAAIDADLVHNPSERTLHVFLGDYIDRGPASRQVVDLVIARSGAHETVSLRGNHETYVTKFLQDPSVLGEWRLYGGLQTLISYGLKPSVNADAAGQRELADRLAAALPKSHEQFLGGLRTSFSCGDYFFVHAGVKPGVPLARQREEDLLWIRNDFLLHENDFEKMVVHGHTPVREPDFRDNRINIDTGAYATGKLTCLIIEGGELAFISTSP
jgi:serine/threonine protein phosphatase 1